MTRTAVVILNYNGRDLLRKFLPAVLQFSLGARIIVADNASTDDSVNILKSEFPSIDLIVAPENLGFCGGYNFALKQVEAEYYVLLNSDVEVTEGWLPPMISLLDTDRTIAAVQPKVLSWHRKNLFEYAGAAGGFIDMLGYPFCRGRIFDTVETDDGQFNDTLQIFWATGACLTIRSKLFHAMEGFDQDFFAHMEEIDLCWRLQRAGQKIYFAGASRVYHVGGGTLPKINPHKTYLNFRNGLTMIVKNMPGNALLWRLPLRMMLDWLSMAAFLAKGSGSNAAAVLKAHVHFTAGFFKTLRKRKHQYGIPFVQQPTQIYRGSVVVDYFLKGRNFFRDLRF